MSADLAMFHFYFYLLGIVVIKLTRLILDVHHRPQGKSYSTINFLRKTSVKSLISGGAQSMPSMIMLDVFSASHTVYNTCVPNIDLLCDLPFIVPYFLCKLVRVDGERNPRLDAARFNHGWVSFQSISSRLHRSIWSCFTFPLLIFLAIWFCIPSMPYRTPLLYLMFDPAVFLHVVLCPSVASTPRALFL